MRRLRLPFELRVRLVYWIQHSWLPFRRPALFHEKLRWKMLKDRRPLLTTFADKVAVRDYVASRVGSALLPECHAVVGDPTELERNRLPREFVVKPNHGSGAVFVVTDPARYHSDLSTSTGKSGRNSVIVSCDNVDWDLLVATCRRWLREDYARWLGEWAYLNVPRKLLVEELLTGPEGKLPPPDYKFFVFHGVVRLVEVHTDRYAEQRRNLFWPDWSPLNIEVVYPRANVEIPRPSRLDDMVQVAQTLGRDTDFVRVDLYDVAGRVVFGELSNYPHGGLGGYKAESLERQLGRWWTLPRRYR